ncbi:hypothetical protein CXG81DRAFT_8374, partial [Caulochytrium protostelioides]
QPLLQTHATRPSRAPRAMHRLVYSDYSTIDWVHDQARDLARSYRLIQIPGLVGRVLRLLDACQSWIVVIAVGLATGGLAAFIDIISEWLSDLKDGRCGAGFYLNRKFCCWHVGQDAFCPEWIPWAAFLVGNDDPHRQGTVRRGVTWVFHTLFYVLFSVLFAFVAAVLVKRYARYAAGSGIAEVKTVLGGFVIRGYLGTWTLVIKTVGLCLSVGSGLALGKEGPLVHVACCASKLLSSLFPPFRANDARQREIMSAAAAAGMSAAFGAPMGGILFSLEEVSSYFPYKTMWRSFVCAMVAALTLQLINPFRTGKLVLFQVAYTRDWRHFELPVFILLGVLGGVYGAQFNTYHLWLARYRRKGWLAQFPVYETVAVAILSALISSGSGLTQLSLGDLLGNLFQECSEHSTDFYGVCDANHRFRSIVLLLMAAAIKAMLTTVTYGLSIPAGIFLPSMAVGACAGRAVGILVQAFYETFPTLSIFSGCTGDTQCVTPGAYAMVGAAAALAGVTRMTVSLTVIMFELTGGLAFVLPTMVTVMVAKWVGDWYDKGGIYDQYIALNQFPILPADTLNYTHAPGARIMAVSHLMCPMSELYVIPEFGWTVAYLRQLLDVTTVSGFPVAKNLLSLATPPGADMTAGPTHATPSSARPRHARHGQRGAMAPHHVPTGFNLRPWMQATPMTVDPTFPISGCLTFFKAIGLRVLFVTRRGRLVGLVTKKDLLHHLHV